MTDARRRPRWPYAVPSTVLLLGFTAVWALAWLVHGLGTCGEDSDISGEEYARLCEGGEIGRNLAVIGVAALLATIGLGTVAIRRRAARPVLGLTVLLTLAALASFNADTL